MKTDKSDKPTETTNPIIELKSTELVEANELTRLREACERFAQLRTFGPLNDTNSRKVAGTPWMLKLGNLPKGTTRTKLDKGVVSDMVAVPFSISETTKDGKPFNVVTLNERLGLEKTAIEGRLPKPLDPTEATKRLIGPIMFAVSKMTFPNKLNKAGKLAVDPEALNMLKGCGFNNWREPNGIAAAFIETISSEITMPVDAFEIVEPTKKSSKSEYPIAEFCTKTDEGLKVIRLSKKDATAILTKECNEAIKAILSKGDEVVIRTRMVKRDEEAKANEIAKQAAATNDAEADEAAKAAALDKLDKDTNEALSLI